MINVAAPLLTCVTTRRTIDRPNDSRRISALVWLSQLGTNPEHQEDEDGYKEREGNPGFPSAGLIIQRCDLLGAKNTCMLAACHLEPSRTHAGASSHRLR